MNPQTLYVLLALADRATSAFKAFEEVKKAADTARAEGRDLTLDDLKRREIGDDQARDFLVQAINDAETT